MNIVILGYFYFADNYIRVAHNNGHKVVVIESDCEKAENDSRVDRVINVNLTGENAYREILDSLDGIQVGAILPGHVFHVALVSKICETLSLPSISYEAALKCLSKIEMRKELNRHSIDQPGFVVFQDGVSLDKLSQDLIVKPEKGFASIGVVRAYDHEQALDYAKKANGALSYSSNVNFDSEVLIEECLTGTEYSAEVLCEAGTITVLGITGKHFNKEESSFETGFFIPTSLSEDDKKKIGDYIHSVYGCLNIDHGLSHCEFVLTDSGPKVIEINPRIGGAHLSDLYDLATGVDLFEVSMNNALGRPSGLNSLSPKGYTSTGWLLGAKGTIKNVTVPEINDDNVRIFVRKDQGSVVPGLGDNRDRVLSIIATDTTNDQVTRTINDIKNQCTVLYYD
ncbi:ATP-grasp domain-containing protein [Enterovibrio coralii]|uniref:ATP-grasp domain-containing protein n=1 Tax=Enterovibrio coralii TaxID=294935 RepID=UPI000A6801BA|nr:ATP-grasp domain-containing protein [Enterovibrio coralii]